MQPIAPTCLSEQYSQIEENKAPRSATVNLKAFKVLESSRNAATDFAVTQLLANYTSHLLISLGGEEWSFSVATGYCTSPVRISLPQHLRELASCKLVTFPLWLISVPRLFVLSISSGDLLTIIFLPPSRTSCRPTSSSPHSCRLLSAPSRLRQIPAFPPHSHPAAGSYHLAFPWAYLRTPGYEWVWRRPRNRPSRCC